VKVKLGDAEIQVSGPTGGCCGDRGSASQMFLRSASCLIDSRRLKVSTNATRSSRSAFDETRCRARAPRSSPAPRSPAAAANRSDENVVEIFDPTAG
jgi:hypothetical protein